MLTISPERVSDIHALNEEFLRIVASAQSGECFGIADATFREIQALDVAAIKRIAATDLLLFSIRDYVSGSVEFDSPQGLPGLVDRLHIVARDFARDDEGLAVSYLNISKEKCNSLMRMGVTQISERAKQHSVQFIPLGTTAFRMLGQLASPSERTQYVALAAND